MLTKEDTVACFEPGTRHDYLRARLKRIRAAESDTCIYCDSGMETTYTWLSEDIGLTWTDDDINRRKSVLYLTATRQMVERAMTGIRKKKKTFV